MIVIQEDLDKEQEGAESQEEGEIVANLYFMIDIVSNAETKVIEIGPKPSYDDLQKAYDELLDDSQTLASHYASLKKSFQNCPFEFENLKNQKKKLGQEKIEL